MQPGIILYFVTHKPCHAPMYILSLPPPPLLYIIITLAGIVTYFAGYNEQISRLKYILARAEFGIVYFRRPLF